MSVADLTGTTWVFNSTITTQTSKTYTLEFATSDFTCRSMSFNRQGVLNYTKTDITPVVVYNRGWTDEAYRTISITGGTSATDSALIAYLEANAVMQVSHDVTISYNNSTIAYLDASGTEVLETNGTICSDDITVEYTKPTPSLQAKTNISPTTSSQTITADGGYDGLSSVQINAISPTKSAQTYMPTTSNQTIAAGQWLSGAQTIAGDANLVAGNIKKDVSIFGVTGTYEGGGVGTPTLSTPVPQYMFNVASVTYGQYRDFVPGYYVPPVGETVYFNTMGRWELSSLYEEATGTPVSFTTISTSRNGSHYSFVMPNAAVAFDLYYND